MQATGLAVVLTIIRLILNFALFKVSCCWGYSHAHIRRRGIIGLFINIIVRFLYRSLLVSV